MVEVEIPPPPIGVAPVSTSKFADSWHSASAAECPDPPECDVPRREPQHPLDVGSRQTDCADRPGKRLIDEAIGRHVANEERLLLSLSEAEQETLSALLKKLIAGL